MDGKTDVPRVSFLRQLDVFNPVNFQPNCQVVGIGAIGSHVVDYLVRFGVPRIEIYDHDIVRPHNVPTGTFEPSQIGMFKVEAVKQRLAGFTDSHVVAHNQAVDRGQKLSGVVFVCVDSMTQRHLVWQHCIKQQPAVVLMVEIRVGPQDGRIYTVQPLDLDQIHWWEQVSNYGDEYETRLACTNRLAVTTAGVMAGLAVQQMVNWHQQEEYAHSLVVGLMSQPLLQADRWVSRDCLCEV